MKKTTKRIIPSWVKTKIALSKAMEISRVTLDRYLSLPGAPEYQPGKGFDLTAVTDFIAEHAHAESTRSKASDSIRALKARELEIICERLSLKLKAERGEYVPVNDVVAAINRVMQPARNILENALCNEFPSRVAGLDPGGIREEARKLMGKICDQMQALGKEFDSLFPKS